MKAETSEVGTSCGRCQFLFPVNPQRPRLEINDFRAEIRSARQGGNMARQGSSNSVPMNARVHLRLAWQEPERSTGMKSDFKQTTKKGKDGKGKLKVSETDLEEPDKD